MYFIKSDFQKALELSIPGAQISYVCLGREAVVEAMLKQCVMYFLSKGGNPSQMAMNVVDSMDSVTIVNTVNSYYSMNPELFNEFMELVISGMEELEIEDASMRKFRFRPRFNRYKNTKGE